MIINKLGHIINFWFSTIPKRNTGFWHRISIAFLVLLFLVACSPSISPSNETAADTVTTQSETTDLERIKEKGTLTIGTSITKPFEYYDPQTSELVGLDVDIAEYIAAEIGVQTEWIEIPFANLLPALEEGKIDIAIAGIYITPERKQTIHFSEPYLETGLIMAVHPDIHPYINSLDDIEGMTVGVKIGATGEKLADELVQQGMELNIARYQDTLDSLLDLEVGRIDIVFNDYLNTLFYIKEYESAIQIVDDKNHETVFLSDAFLGIAVNKQNTELLEEINSLLLQMEQNNITDVYYRKWLLPEN
jgi:ABC-type amino acid transport substrate-binding protein